jgi:hypothetical protein
VPKLFTNKTFGTRYEFVPEVWKWTFVSKNGTVSESDPEPINYAKAHGREYQKGGLPAAECYLAFMDGENVFENLVECIPIEDLTDIWQSHAIWT